jgi:hypothetical protein
MWVACATGQDRLANEFNNWNVKMLMVPSFVPIA